MDVDNDIDGQLLQQFSCMATQDKEVLIKQFQNLLGNELNPDSCAFYLDMTNWNLQAAIGAFYDFDQQPQNVKVPCMGLVKDITIGEGESIPPNTSFIKTWRVKNTGSEAWPPGCCLRFTQGEQFGHRDRVMILDHMQPGAEINISVEMVSPSTTGMYQGQWRMQTATGVLFGDMVWVILHVEESGLLGVTQQLSTINTEFSHGNSEQNTAPNPFASPGKSCGDFAPTPGQVSPVIQRLFGSPTPSLITHHGSLPSSPAAPQHSPNTQPNGSGASPGAAFCTALFQTPSGAESMSECPSTHMESDMDAEMS